MERMMDRLDIADRTPPRENQPGPQIRNPNFRRNQPQIRQREQREQRGPDQQIRPPFQENYVDEGEEIVEDLDDVHINLMGINDNDSVFLTQEEHDLFLLSQTEIDHEESEDYKQGFENAIMEVHRQYNLRSKKSTDNPTKKTLIIPLKRQLTHLLRKFLTFLLKRTQKFQPKKHLILSQKQLKLIFPLPASPKIFHKRMLLRNKMSLTQIKLKHHST
jgi:hypothetical protein